MMTSTVMTRKQNVNLRGVDLSGMVDRIRTAAGAYIRGLTDAMVSKASDDQQEISFSYAMGYMSDALNQSII